jgi:predicted ABC-type ATPase
MSTTNPPNNAPDALTDVLGRLSDPLLIALAGSNGAGKSTFHRVVLSEIVQLPFVNADEIAKTLPGKPGPARDYEAARMAEELRQKLLSEGRSHCTETVFSDPRGEKLGLLDQAQQNGFCVLLIFVGIPDAALSQARVMNRVANGGHDVPDEKLWERYPRTLENLAKAVEKIRHVLIFDNSSRDKPYQPIARVENGAIVWQAAELPDWAKTALREVL